MLRLERMEISGFKSFGDKTEVRFPKGITAVVGPNGCGKSNIGDALNWALGEQSAKMLRGKQMADVIFVGTRNRKPLGMAQVSLHLVGAEGYKQGDQGRIVVTRRLFRSGESEYRINDKRVRLKDIQELLHEARVGARSYATIEQGRIDEILKARPKERRLLVEDAAGIASYKNKRRLTELKLEATEANLLRVNDIVVEVERQIRSLKRQASKARRYRRLREELREKERTRFGVRAVEMDAELVLLREREKQAKDGEAGAAAELARKEVGLGEERTALERADQSCRETAHRVHELELEIDREESRIRSCKERIEEASETAGRQAAEAERLAQRLAETSGLRDEQQSRIDQGKHELDLVRERHSARQAFQVEAEEAQRELREEIEALRRRQFETVNRAAELRNGLRATVEGLERIGVQRVRLEAEQVGAQADSSRLRGETDDLAGRLESQREQLAQLDQARNAREERLVALREALAAESETLARHREMEQSAAARLRTLEDVATRFAGVSDGVRTLLSDGVDAGIRALGVVADFIEARTDVEGVAEGYLRGFLPTVIVQDDSDVHRAAELLRSVGAGRTNLISSSQPVGGPAVGVAGNGSRELPAELTGDPRVMGRLGDGLTLRSSSNGVVRDRMGDALLVDSLESALALHRSHPGVDYLTPDGDVVYASGVVAAGGSSNGDHGLLAHRRRMEEARSALGQAAEGITASRERVDANRDELGRIEEESQRLRGQYEEASRRMVELEMQVQRSTEESRRSDRRAEVLADELASLANEAADLQRRREELAQGVESAESAHREVEADLRDRAAAAAGREEELRQLSDEVAGLRAELAARQQRQEGLDLEGRRLSESVDELQARVDAAESEAHAARERAVEARELMQRTEADLVAHLEENKLLRGKTEELEREIEERRRQLSGREGELREARERLEELRESTRGLELERTRAEADRQHLDELCAQELGVPAADLSTAVAPEEVEAVDLAALEAEVAEIRGKIERIGPVNMTAIEEFSELEERHSFLTEQRRDLEQSMASLRESIKRINRTSRERFAEAFEAIRKSYQEIFAVLFNGGRADLRLEENEDVLDAGIEILAQPPGKRLSGVQLLSGGEKALSAIALLFAVFRYQPSPFCLMDEVDAALDDANIGRFARMVRQYAENTQFIIITHNKLSMESADLLYGVTMEEPGVSKLVSMDLQ